MNIKPANVLLFNHENQAANVKLADHGELTHRDFPGADLLTKPPECLEDGAHTAQGDVWQLGVLFFTLLTLESPFAGRTVKRI